VNKCRVLGDHFFATCRLSIDLGGTGFTLTAALVIRVHCWNLLHFKTWGPAIFLSHSANLKKKLLVILFWHTTELH
jgi:hypothetical protein